MALASPQAACGGSQGLHQGPLSAVVRQDTSFPSLKQLDGCTRSTSKSFGSDMSNTEPLRQEYFMDPCQWWDSRKNQVNPSAPDFTHRPTEELLWMEGPYNLLEENESKSKGMHEAKASTGQIRLKSQEQGKALELQDDSSWERLTLEEALTSLERMPQLPSFQNFICILQKCRKGKNIAYAKRLHAYMCKSGLEAHRSLGNFLIPMLVECGRMCDALQVFKRLVDPNEYAWTSLIMGYVECGISQDALILYQEMQADCVRPSEHTFVALLKACARLKNVERGQKIHAEITSKGLDANPFVGNTLIDMYTKCGLLDKAKELFDKLPARDVISWNVLIAGYAEHGLGEDALNCFQQMQLEGVSPDAVTFVCSLKACSRAGAIDKGLELHSEIFRKGLESVPSIGNTLVGMYAKCGLLAEARELLDKLQAQDVVSWNALIAGYADHGFGVEALDFFGQMRVEGLSPDVVTLVCSLKACGSTGAIEKGQEIHTEIARKGWEREPFVGNTLVDMYAKCGSVAEAQKVFDKLQVQDVVSWNALIAGYAEQGLGEEALDCFEQMHLDGVSPDAVTFVCSLKACGYILTIGKGREIHAEIARGGLEKDPFVGNTLVDIYAKCGLFRNAQEVFDKLPVQDVVSWSALIKGYADHGLGEEALHSFKLMQLKGVSPDAVTFVGSLKACGSTGAVDKGQEIHANVSRMGLDRVLFVGNTLVDMYAKCGSLGKAREVFDKLAVQDIVSWNALISGYAEQGLGEEALNCFEEMQLEDVSPDAVTLVCSLKACGIVRAIDMGQEIHAEIARKGLEGDLYVGNTLIDMYAKCGSLAKAQELFEKLPVQDVISWSALITGYADHGLCEEAHNCFEQMKLQGVSPDVVSWGALIAGYAQSGEGEIVFDMFERMIGEGVTPNGVTFLSVLSVCSHVGLVNKGQKLFEAMIKDYGITPSIEHHIGMVDLLCRAGRLDEGIAMVEKMPFQPVLPVWHTVLGACRKWGNVELGRQAFEHAVRLDEKDSAAYVLMSSIYAVAGMHEEEKKVEAMRITKQAWNKPGQSWTEVDIPFGWEILHMPKAKM